MVEVQLMRIRQSLLALTLFLCLGVALANWSRPDAVRASDHDDGETSVKARNVSMTDVFFFRETDQQNQIDSGTRTFGGGTDPNRLLVAAMNVNPRSVPRQQYYFSTSARYEIHVRRVTGTANSTANAFPANGGPDFTLRFTFGAPSSDQQAITFQRVNFLNGAEVSTTLATGLIVTTPNPPGIGNPNPTRVVNSTTMTTNGTTDSNISVFAGLAEDPFFFDVTQYFKLRAGALLLGPAVGFRTAANAIDFAKDYNVLNLSVRAPRDFFSRNSDGTLNAATAYDVWGTISVPQ
ncbi:MAG: DUF4331 domain-containing protein [Armatimonadetes bacterium]|nr:DUF4331 domain-containing protein [Armatimonadota bacterium]